MIEKTKTITSTVDKFPGTFTLPANLNYAQCVAFEDGIAEIKEFVAGKEYSAKLQRELDKMYQPIIDACVISHDIDGWWDEFPFTPRAESSLLIILIIDEIRKLHRGELEIPKEPESEPTAPLPVMETVPN